MYSQKFYKIQNGFTLIELLVVIAVIGVLTTIASVNFIGVRERARDAERKADLAQIQTALEFYRTDSGSYPASIACPGPMQYNSTVYLQKTPCDPSTNVKYDYILTGSTYTLDACLENELDKDKVTGSTSCGGNNGKVLYRVVNP